MSDENIQLKVRISREVNRRLKQYVTTKYPDSLRGHLSEEVEKALIYFLDNTDKVNSGSKNTHTHGPATSPTSTELIEENNKILIYNNNNNNNNKYKKLIGNIKKYSNSEKQISSGLAKKAIRETIGKDERTVQKYLKLLQDDDILYGNSRLGIYDVQSWVFDDYNKDNNLIQQKLQQ
jgi:hypothetical protein